MTQYEPDLSILDNYDDEDTSTPLVKHLRKEVERAAKASKKAFEEGQKAQTQEYEKQKARQESLADVPAVLHAQFADIDPSDKASIDVRKQQLQAGGVTWGQSDQQPPPQQPVDQPPSLDRMAQAAAGGSVPNSDDDRAQKLKQRIDAGQGFGNDDEERWFLDYVESSRQDLGQARSKGFS